MLSSNSYYPHNNADTNKEMLTVIKNANNRKCIWDFEEHQHDCNVPDNLLLMNKIVLVYLFSKYVSMDWKRLSQADIDDIEQSIIASAEHPDHHKTGYTNLLRDFQDYMDTR